MAGILTPALLLVPDDDDDDDDDDDGAGLLRLGLDEDAEFDLLCSLLLLLLAGPYVLGWDTELLPLATGR